jgi:hypothetical protein
MSTEIKYKNHASICKCVESFTRERDAKVTKTENGSLQIMKNQLKILFLITILNVINL